MYQYCLWHKLYIKVMVLSSSLLLHACTSFQIAVVVFVVVFAVVVFVVVVFVVVFAVVVFVVFYLTPWAFGIEGLYHKYYSRNITRGYLTL